MPLIGRIVKRTLDLLLASAGTFLTFIPLCIISLIVKIRCPGPVLFKQMRVGRHGRLFKCIKIRTMAVNSEQHGTVTTACDERITTIGRLLRRHKLDELPQIWNVLVGHMSFVGPRPDVPGFADRLKGESRRILELRPGITGPATLRFRNEEAILAQVAEPERYNNEVIYPEKVRFNLDYIENWSFWRDLEYIMITVAPSLSHKIGIDRRLGLTDEVPRNGVRSGCSGCRGGVSQANA